MTPYVEALLAYIRPESQGAYVYDYRRFAKDPNTALLLTVLLGLVGGECYYLGQWKRGVLMSLALFTGIAVFITVPMWIVRCFTISSEIESYNDYLAYMLAFRYLPHGNAPQPPQPVTNPTQRGPIGGLPMPVNVR